MALWYPCCGGPTFESCTWCVTGTTPKQVQITIPAVGDGTCDCSGLAGDYILPQVSGNPCYYQADFEIDMGGCGLVTYTLQAHFQGGMFTGRRFVIYEQGSIYMNAVFQCADLPDGESGQFDCTGTPTLTYQYSDTGDGKCQWTAMMTVEWESLY